MHVNFHNKLMLANARCCSKQREETGAYPKTLSAAAVANRGSSGSALMNAAARAVTEHPAAVMDVSISTPLCTLRVRLPSVTCA